MIFFLKSFIHKFFKRSFDEKYEDLMKKLIFSKILYENLHRVLFFIKSSQFFFERSFEEFMKKRFHKENHSNSSLFSNLSKIFYRKPMKIFERSQKIKDFMKIFCTKYQQSAEIFEELQLRSYAICPMGNAKNEQDFEIGF